MNKDGQECGMVLSGPRSLCELSYPSRDVPCWVLQLACALQRELLGEVRAAGNAATGMRLQELTCRGLWHIMCMAEQGRGLGAAQEPGSSLYYTLECVVCTHGLPLVNGTYYLKT